MRYEIRDTRYAIRNMRYEIRDTRYAIRTHVSVRTAEVLSLTRRTAATADFVRNRVDTDPILHSASGSSLFERDERAILEFLKPSIGAGPAIIQRFRIYHDTQAGDFAREIIQLLDQVTGHWFFAKKFSPCAASPTASCAIVQEGPASYLRAKVIFSKENTTFLFVFC